MSVNLTRDVLHFNTLRLSTTHTMFAHKKYLAENYSFFFEKKEKKGNFAAANKGKESDSL